MYRYRLGSHIHSGYRMNFSCFQDPALPDAPPSFLITNSPFLWLLLCPGRENWVLTKNLKDSQASYFLSTGTDD